MEIFWTRHATDRQKEWERKLKITRQEVEALLTAPEQVIPGDRGVLVAQGIRESGLLRAPFVDTEGGRKVLTVYWTSKIQKYWRSE